MKLAIVGFVLLLTASVAFAKGPTTAPVARSLFDPVRHMRVAEVKPGMKGHGVSVFSGTKLERFDVEVISVLKNFNPKCDVVLIKCAGANLEHTGAIAGMSGSPIYLDDGTGKERMIGAFAYGWSLNKDPIAGVQPIEYMLNIPEPKPEAEAAIPMPQPGGTRSAGRWSIDQLVMLPGMTSAPAGYPLASLGSMRPNPQLNADAEAMRLRPLATPLMASGLSPKLIEQFGPLLQAHGMVPLQAGGGADGANEPEVQLEPGSVLAVPILTGDVDMSAIGTVTEVLDGRMFGFGHAFQSEGPISLPMGSGKIHSVIASIATSFKLGSMTQLRGTLNADHTVGVAGRLGQAPKTVPIDLRISYADGSLDVPYHFDAALHPRLTPMIAAMALQSAVSGARDLPQYHTLDYDLTLSFANGQSIQIKNTAVNTTPSDLFYEIGTPMMALAENPFERVLVKQISGTMKVSSEVRAGEIIYANVPKLKYRPGETVKAFVTYRPFRSTERVMSFDMELPHDLPDGTYRLIVSDWTRHIEEQRQTQPFRFTAENVPQVISLLKELSGVRRNALYVRLVRQSDGVAVGRTAMPKLPASRRQVLLSAGRSNTTAFVSSTVKVIPTELVMSGSAEFSITIDTDVHTEHPRGREGVIAPPMQPVKIDEPKTK